MLVEPTQPGNIGATARAMDNMGVTDLRLVNPCEYFHPEARMFAMSARYLLHEARTFDTLAEAVEDCHLIVATSARPRDKIQTSTSIVNLPEIIGRHSPDTSVAIVFGQERSGLTNEDMSLCNEWTFIPTYGKNSSLNLAQAVLVVLYELSKSFQEEAAHQEKHIMPASSKSIEGMKEHFFRILERTGFLRDGSRESMWGSFSDLIGRAKPDKRDVRMIRGFFNRIEVSLRRNDRSSR
ncbi:MAG: RNA methyltransferase [Proteobacteria bacterium]|nr:RNA methyltransferase [Pseudomonadota bacterium]